jgi:colanic acid biosynthesis glycosyl transferase WcaI
VIFSQVFPPEIGASEHRMERIARAMTETGRQVVVISEMPNHPVGVVPEVFRRRFAIWTEQGGLLVLRTFVWTRPKKPFIVRLLFYISHMISAVVAGMRLQSVGFVLALSPSPFNALGGAVLARLKGAAFAIDAHDLWPEDAVDIGQLRNVLAIRIASKLSSWLYKQATVVFVPSTAYIDLICAQGIPQERIVHVPLGTDTSIFRQVDSLPFRRKHELVDSFLVVYAGRVSLTHGLDVIIEAATVLQDKCDVVFLIVGEGVERPRLETLVRKQGLKNVRFMPPVPPKEVVPVICAADIVLCPLANSPRLARTPTGKIYDLLACARPVVVCGEGEAADILRDAGADTVVPAGDGHALAEVIRVASKRGINAPKFALKRVREKYDFPVIRDRVLKALEPYLPPPTAFIVGPHRKFRRSLEAYMEVISRTRGKLTDKTQEH